jgi:large subunit ribosomal protein L15
MKLHDLRPAEGSRTPKTRVGRGIAAGKGKTAGRGTKGQKARAGGSIPPWFEGGQTPLHRRIPKLRGFRNRFKIEYEVVNVGAIAAAAERGAFETDPHAKGKAAPITVNQDVLRAVGLVRTLNKPLKVLGGGDLSTPLFVVADAFTASARTKIEGAGGSVTVLEIPDRPREALGVTQTVEEASAAGETAEATAEPVEAENAPPKPARTRRSKAAAAESEPEPDATAAPAAEEAETEAAAPAGAAAEAEPVVEDEQPETGTPSGESA